MMKIKIHNLILIVKVNRNDLIEYRLNKIYLDRVEENIDIYFEDEDFPFCAFKEGKIRSY